MAPSKKAHYDETDVEKALAKTDTADGSGFESEDELPESDFVEAETDEDEEGPQ